MRTKPAHIEPSCPFCNFDHNPDIECRYKPVAHPRGLILYRELIKDASGKTIGVRTVEA